MRAKNHSATPPAVGLIHTWDLVKIPIACKPTTTCNPATKEQAHRNIAPCLTRQQPFACPLPRRSPGNHNQPGTSVIASAARQSRRPDKPRSW